MGASLDDVGQRLDAFRARMTPTYRLPDGREVRAPSQFHARGGRSPELDGRKLNEALGKGHGISGNMIGRAVSGKGTPEDIRRITQRLLDQGKLPPPEPGETDERRIQRVQWQYGVGVDGPGYTRQAFLASWPSGEAAYGLANDPLNEAFGSLARNKAFCHVAPVDARPGDIVVLDKPHPRDVGHEAIVVDRRRIDPSTVPGLSPEGRLHARAFAGGAKVEAFKVDSSWGAGKHGLNGGVQRRTWLYNPTTEQWADVDLKTGRVRVNARGPYEHPLAGIFSAPREA